MPASAWTDALHACWNGTMVAPFGFLAATNCAPNQCGTMAAVSMLLVGRFQEPVEALQVTVGTTTLHFSVDDRSRPALLPRRMTKFPLLLQWVGKEWPAPYSDYWMFVPPVGTRTSLNLRRGLLSYSRFHAVCDPFGNRAASPTGTCIAGGTVR